MQVAGGIWPMGHLFPKPWSRSMVQKDDSHFYKPFNEYGRKTLELQFIFTLRKRIQ